MSLVDLILIILVGGFILFGFWFGFIHALGSLVGVIAGAFIAGIYYDNFGNWLAGIFGFEEIARLVAFIILFIVVNRLVGLIFYFVNRIFQIISIIPFLKSINRLLGGLLGLIEAVLVLGLIVYVLTNYQVSTSWGEALTESWLAGHLMWGAEILKPFLPELI